MTDEKTSTMVNEDGHDYATENGIGDTKLVVTNDDAGAVFVLESKGTWKHAAFHITTSIVAPAILSMPFAFAGVGWAPGILILTLGAAGSFYSYRTLSQVLEHAELEGHRLLRFRHVGGYVLGVCATNVRGL